MQAQAKQRTGPCTGPRAYVTREMPPSVQKAHVRWLVACAVLQYPVPGGLNYALSIAERESGLNPYAVNRSSGCAGVFQFAPSTFAALVKAWPVMNRWSGTWILSARSNVLRAIRTAHETGWGPWSL